MKVTVERHGGFAGFHCGATVEGDALSAEQREALAAVQSAGPAPADPGADHFVYKIEIEDEGGKQVLRVPESRMPSVLAKIATQ
ncbi:MAG TPA: protealysin inhibitor emfourin [Acetobacteraceae bacterium]|nr:protealysin inhibitor emfourin [Acetobacteraceae bacterium]